MKLAKDMKLAEHMKLAKNMKLAEHMKLAKIWNWLQIWNWLKLWNWVKIWNDLENFNRLAKNLTKWFKLADNWNWTKKSLQRLHFKMALKILKKFWNWATHARKLENWSEISNRIEPKNLAFFSGISPSPFTS